jgi:hypothetical protein
MGLNNMLMEHNLFKEESLLLPDRPKPYPGESVDILLVNQRHTAEVYLRLLI